MSTPIALKQITRSAAILDRVVSKWPKITYIEPDGRVISACFALLKVHEFESLLELNTRNRSVDQRSVDRIASNIVDNDWQVNGDAIRFGEDDDGEVAMLDAQHRCLAAVKAGVDDIPVQIIWGLDPDVADLIDGGKPRTVADILVMAIGQGKIPYAVEIGSIGRLLLDGTVGRSHSKREIARFIGERFEEIAWWAEFAKSVSTGSQPITSGARRHGTSLAMTAQAAGVLAMHMVDSGADADSVIDFFRRIAKGGTPDADQTNVIDAIRTRQRRGVPLGGAAGGSRSQVMAEFANYIVAYNKWVKGQPSKVIKPSKEVSKFSDLPAVETTPSPFPFATWAPRAIPPRRAVPAPQALAVADPFPVLPPSPLTVI